MILLKHTITITQHRQNLVTRTEKLTKPPSSEIIVDNFQNQDHFNPAKTYSR